MTQRYYQNTRKPVAGALVAACVASITLASCAAGNVLNGHPAPSLSTSTPDSTAASGSLSQTQPATSAPETPSRKATSGSRSSAQTATTQPSRPYRPNSVIAGLFANSLVPQLCMTVAAGSSGTVFTIQRFVAQLLCFTGLDTSVPPSLVITTPEGTRETIALTSDSSKWDVTLTPVPGQGAEASLGEYSFQVMTPIPGSASTSPTAGVMTTSGHFTVVPDAQPSAAVGDGSTVGAEKVSLPAGSQLYVWFSGFPGFSMVYVSLYGPGASRKYPLLVDLPGVRTDRHGEGTASWAIPSGAALSEYVIWIDPPFTACSNPCMAFTVTR